MERSPKKFSRRELLGGIAATAMGLSFTPEVEANEIESVRSESVEVIAERRQRIYLELREKITSQEIEAKVAAIQDWFGPAASMFFAKTAIHESLRLIRQLEHYQLNDAVWSNAHSPAARLEKIYEQHWNAQVFTDRRQQNTSPIDVRDFALAGFDSAAEVEDFFADGKFFPKGWLRNEIKYIQWKTTFAGPLKKYSGYTINELPNPGETDADAHMMVATDSSVRGATPFYIQMATVYHEIGHANDWRSADQPTDKAIELCWKILQRIQASDRGDYQYTKFFAEKKDTPNNRWNAAIEYWADICRDYLQHHHMNANDQAVVEWWVKLSDPSFDPSRVWLSADVAAIKISLRSQDAAVADLLANIPDTSQRAILSAAWQEQRQGLLGNKAHSDFSLGETLEKIATAAAAGPSTAAATSKQAARLAAQYNMLYQHVSFKYIFAQSEIDLSQF